MDSVRFGRALGFGARQAAKTLVTAVDAATAPNPSPKPADRVPHRPAPTQQTQTQQTQNQWAQTQPTSPSPTRAARVGEAAARSTGQLRDTTRGLKRGSRRFGQAVWGPVVKLSGVLWLELTGVFFGLFALFAGVAAWKLRGSLYRTPTNADAHLHAELALGMALLFGYFSFSSFVRANRRGRRS